LGFLAERIGIVQGADNKQQILLLKLKKKKMLSSLNVVSLKRTTSWGTKREIFLCGNAMGLEKKKSFSPHHS
jgi:hypothetical protein